MEMITSQDTSVVLDTPIKRGDSEISEVMVTKPNAGSLRGIGLAALANADVDALITILPRVTYPNLTKEECARLELPDLIALAGMVIGFLAPKSAE
ncbi:phage tail assembly protein [Serratia rhizosphaerae]|uniref:phage tail assembly protein n=1 Tax=Serratia TaxID=613 RepID=UPI000CF66D20|nr:MULTISPECIES: phage tail assembly protein [Serratia]AVJ16355.1 phage tail protein [Serratia sp. MYb239]MBD8453575.1 phage tail assembly protein [Serratia rubidaea]MCA4821979.1 phage tail assembly protein [Serratia rubidaea]MCR0996609.1 phage tail assembly protein [Serratia rubidaea]MDK1704925.1 phage tail assembly protein [Serratia rubidaea]